MRILVLGAGAFGAATAHHLATHGHQVDLVDRAGLAGGTSGLGAGILSMGLPHAEDRALVLASLRGLDPLLQRAAGRRPTRPGSHHLAAEGPQAHAVDTIATGLARLGVPAETWTADEWAQDLRRRGLAADADGVHRVLSIPDDAWVPAVDVVHAMTAASEGVTFHRTTVRRLKIQEARRVRHVTGADLLDGTRVTADATVVALGAWTRRFLLHHGFRFPVQAYRTHAAVLAGPVPAGLPIIHDAPLGHYLRPHGPGTLLVGDGTRLDTTRPEGFNTDAEPEFVPGVKARLARRWPEMKTLHLEAAWRGVLTATPDRRPLVGPHPEADGLITAAGGNGFGIMRSWAIGAVAAAAAAGTPLPPGLTQEHVAWMDPGRFWPEPPEWFQPREGFTLEP